MIERIYIPTVCRVDNQITYHNLPKELQKRVIFVVQEWERDQYHYDAEYMVLPPEITLGSHNTLAHTRKLIYEDGKNSRYAMLDDDLHFKRRNSKYWNGISNMEKSTRICSDDDVLEMFELFDNWLDNGITFCGCWQQNNPPSNHLFEDNRSMTATYWINGYDWAKHIDNMYLTNVKVAEDILLILGLLSRGYRNRISNEFIVSYKNATKKNDSVLWDSTEFEEVHKDHKFIEKMFPRYYKILYDENNERIPGGYQNFGKTKIQWTKAYKESQIPKLDKFF